MKKNNFKKSLLVFLILLTTIFFIPKINSFENKINDDLNYNNYINSEKTDSFLKSKNSIYVTLEAFGVHNYVLNNDDENKTLDDLQNINFRKLELKNKDTFENKNHIIFDKKQQELIINSGNIFYVGGSGPNNYSKIQDAINDSCDGDTVFVYDDSSPYHEHIIINKSINLIGENTNSTEINGSKLNEFVDTINVTADNVYITGFRINYNPGYYYQAAINISRNNVIVTNCKIHNNNWIGVSLYGSLNSKIINCELFNNLMAVHLVDSDENEINTCYCYSNAEDIILFKNSNNNKIVNCICTGNSFSAIQIQYSKNNQIINCSCSDGYGGIGIAFAPGTIMRGNTLNNNYENFGIGSSILTDFYCDIDTTNKINGKPIYYWLDNHDKQIPLDAAFIGLVSCTNILIKNLQINNNFQAVVFADSSNCTIEDCNFFNNEGHGVFSIISQHNTIKNCSIGNSFFSGVYLSSQTNNNVILNNTIDNISNCGLWFDNSKNNNIFNNVIKNCLRALLLDSSSDNILKNNKMEKCGIVVNGINVSDYKNDVDTSNKVNDKTLYYYIDQNNLVIPTDAGQIILINCTKCNISNLEINNATIAITLAFSSYNTIYKNILNNNKLVAVDLDCFSNNHNNIIQNTIVNNNYAIDVDLSDYNTVYNNILKNNKIGITFDTSKSNTISENDIQNSYNAIHLSKSLNNNINNNTIKECDFAGIYLLFSKNNIIRNNEMLKCGLIVYGTNVSEYINDVDTSNKVNGKILYYHMNQNNIKITDDAGQVILINCNYCNVTNLDLNNGTIGVQLVFSSFINISKNQLNNNKFAGIYIESSINNIVEKNTIKNNSYGVNLQLANNNKINNNNINKNFYGCHLYLSDFNTIFFNNFLYNSYGVFLKKPCNNNTVYCNNLIENGYNAWDENENTNTWYNNKKGNYWDDYTKKYPNAKKLILKGVWDIAYEIPNKENKDMYPLLRPTILSNEKIKTQLLTRFFEKIKDFLNFFNFKQNIIY